MKRTNAVVEDFDCIDSRFSLGIIQRSRTRDLARRRNISAKCGADQPATII